MGRKPSSSPSSSFLFRITALKYFSPGYYLRRPRRLGFIFLLVGLTFFFLMDRQNQARELETLSARIQQLEGEKGALQAKVANLHGKAEGSLAVLNNSASSQHGGQGSSTLGKGVRADPLILGVGVGSGARKLLPEKKAGAKRAMEQKEEKAETKGGEEKSSSGGASNGTSAADKAEAERRRESIRQGMIHAWKGYEQFAWGDDELEPQSRTGANDFGRMGATIVDALDTLYIMGLKEQFNKAKDWVALSLSFDKSYTCSVFETTIRVMGGLLSAFDLSGEAIFLTKARELADRLLPAWGTKSGIPWHYLDLKTGQGSSAGWAGHNSILADVGTTQLEMIALSQRTNDSRYGEASENVITVIAKKFPDNGLVPIYLSPDTGDFYQSHITFGAMGDSFYEYLLKVWVLGGKTEAVKRYRDMWEKSMKGMMSTLVRKTKSGLTYLAEENGGSIINKMDHLLCFTPGMLALGAVDADKETAAQYLDLAKELARTCNEFYQSQPTKLSGENYNFHNDMSVGQAYNIGRPETVEGLFYLWRFTKDPIYREWGWQIWQAFEKHCKMEGGGYTGLRNVAMDPPEKDNKMQSFFLAETLKYLFLLFSEDDVIPLDQWVFNTEAHPIRIIPRSRRR